MIPSDEISGGRPFRDATGTPSVARTMVRSDWMAEIAPLAVADVSPDERAALAAHWTREAAFEHASAAAFAQLALDLVSFGAPPELLVAAHRAALDEIDHARVAFALASAYGGSPVGPAPLAARPGPCRSLAQLARTTFLDACLGESVASAVLAEAARATSDHVVRDLCSGMAADEARHAELGFRVVAWALRGADEEVAATLAAARDAVTDELVSLTQTLDGGRDELRATVLREVVLPGVAALLTGSGPGPSSSRGSRRFASS